MQWPYAYQKSLVSFWDIPNLKRSWCRINNWPSTQWDWKVEGWNNHSLNVSDSGSIWHPSWECSGCSKLGQRDDIQSHCRIWWWIIPCQSECEEGATRLTIFSCLHRKNQTMMNSVLLLSCLALDFWMKLINSILSCFRGFLPLNAMTSGQPPSLIISLVCTMGKVLMM